MSTGHRGGRAREAPTPNCALITGFLRSGTALCALPVFQARSHARGAARQEPFRGVNRRQPASTAAEATSPSWTWRARSANVEANSATRSSLMSTPAADSPVVNMSALPTRT